MTDSATAPAIDFSSFDADIRVQDDLFRHVNGRWLEATEIPADKPITGAFILLRDKAEAAVRDIITTIEPDESARTRPRSPISTPASWTSRRSKRSEPNRSPRCSPR